jgi:hypothetical protein
MPSKQLIIDDEFAKLNDPQDTEERIGLEADIVAEGCHDSLKVWKGHDIILDGMTRYKICTRHGKPYKVEYIDLADKPTAALWILDCQGHRRNLTTVQKAARASKRKGYMVAQAEERQKENLKKGREIPVRQLVASRETGKATDLAAKAEGVSGETVRQYEKVMTEGTPEVKAAMKAGKTSIKAAAKATTAPSTPKAPGEPPPAAPVEKDAVGHVLPDKLRPVFTRAKDIQALMHRCSSFKAELVKLAATPKDPIWGRFNASAFTADIDHVRQLLKAVKPHAICPYCAGGDRGGGANCTACEGTGWLDEYRYHLAPKEMRE